MIKTVLTALNAKYVHSSLALRYLKNYSKEFFIDIAEFSINDSLYSIYSALLEKRAEVYGFSCYIWNIEQTLKAAQLLKKALPEAIIILGGPEAGYNAKSVLYDNLFVDGIIVGEGEETLNQLLKLLDSGKRFSDIPSVPGLFVRNREFVFRERLDLSLVSQPYSEEDIESLTGRIIYFETSKGCPFNCSYCLSSKEGAVRPFPMDYVKKGLAMLFDKKVPLVKLIDRTFNYDSRRAAEILRFILEKSTVTCVHFEIEPRILTDELIEILGSAPKGKFQVEMGIQSANPNTLSAIGRKFDIDKTAENIRRLKAFGNMHIHLDLIAGLPYEDMESFKKSFNYAYSLKPDMLQLGFLKVLKGTEIEKQEDVVSADFPPYEVISTKWMTAEDICSLKETEEAVEVFYNSNAFPETIAEIVSADAFEAFENLGRLLKKWQQKGRIKRQRLYQLLFEHCGDKLRDALSVDFIMNNKNVPLPEFTVPERERGFKDKAYKLMHEEWFCSKYNVKPELSNLRFERMNGRAYMMDYINNNLADITEEIEKVTPAGVL